MVKVFLHHEETQGKSDWINEDRELARIPHVGEYVALSDQGPWYRVYAVVHCLFDADFDAEVYLAVDASSTEAILARKPLSST